MCETDVIEVIAKEEPSVPHVKKLPENVAVYNYTGHPVHFIDNVIDGPEDRKVIAPEQGPHIIHTIQPSGRLMVTNDTFDIGSVNGVPVSVCNPMKIMPVPDIDGIIIVTSVYYRAAYRAGLDTSNLYILRGKTERKTNHGSKFYYTGIIQRL